MSSRDPFPSTKFENGFTLSGIRPPQRKTCDKPTHIAQTEQPWSRLHDTATLASTRRSVMHYERQVTIMILTFIYDTREIFQGKRTLSTLNAPLFSQPQAPNDSLDFQLKSVYDHHKDFFWRKNQILYQKETVSEDQRKQETLKQDMQEKEQEKNIRVWVDPQRCSIYSIK
ncbi:protein C1orf194 homolog isoform X1 [Siniperca chuatsi]|uniref:protein C1orf194 homolog isoform X1 n=1 Tax=Siniperca chuatsi TaxID=119488 RepID=UPI001CE09195|nr:protein C1orf194 homolog isoform X1 [Siniperca chuatsi]XP_044068264.1 protein C1orf194 homolog isoform X1 [Siniperca chuatsi]